MIPVVMSGGSGSRLWPVSRQSFPKQFCDFLDESLFSKTLKRLKPLGSPWTLTVGDLRVLTERTLKQEGIPASQGIYEPFGRNTAPAIALLCRILELRGLKDEVVGVFPADQLIDDDRAFQEAVRKGETLAKQGHIVTLGVKPTFPATGYGYIETSGSMESGALSAVGFREKPNESTAREFIARGGFYWNAGMFIFKVSKMMELLSVHVPDVWSAFLGMKDPANAAELERIYKAVRAISIDYAVMEKLSKHACIPCAFQWSDLGSWDAIADVLGEKAAGASGKVEVGGGKNFVFGEAKKTYAFVGVTDVVLIDTPDAVLVARKGQTERVKEVVDELKNRSVASATQHQFEVRPWGSFQVLKDADDFKSKTITVDAGAQISYQSHEKRAEHWIIVKGKGEVVLDGETIPVSSGQHVLIPLRAKHRIRNTGTEPLQFVEVQLGSYFGENDIIRYEDDYKRA